MKGSPYKLEAIGDIVRESLLVKQAILGDHQLLETVASVGEKMVLALKDGKKLFFFGNGGSAADAQHLAAEFVGRFNRQRRALPAIALTTDTSVLTSISNDYSYDSVFARQLEGLGSPGDIAVGISTSGNSPNVLSGIRFAKQAGLVAVGITGLSGRALLELSDYCIRVPSDHTPRIQEVHILIVYILCEMVDESLTS
jgi:D-sedoheptulose 7-phosphate isomerase